MFETKEPALGREIETFILGTDRVKRDREFELFLLESVELPTQETAETRTPTLHLTPGNEFERLLACSGEEWMLKRIVTVLVPPFMEPIYMQLV